MTRIGVVSDTHGPLPGVVFDLFHGDIDGEHMRAMIKKLYRVSYDGDEVFVSDVSDDEAELAHAMSARANVDLIVHAGDIGRQSVLDELGAIARTIAVAGNNDYDGYFASDGSVRLFRSFDFDGVSIALAHIPAELNAALHGRGPLQPALVKQEPQLAIHGHTHVPRVEVQQRHVVLCPGSPTRARNNSGHNVALVDIEDGRLHTIAILAV